MDFMESIVCITAFVEMMPLVTASQENVTVQVASLEQPVKNVSSSYFLLWSDGVFQCSVIERLSGYEGFYFYFSML